MVNTAFALKFTFEPAVPVNCANNFITKVFIHRREYTQTWQNSGIESSVKIVCTCHFPLWHGSDTVLDILYIEVKTSSRGF